MANTLLTKAQVRTAIRQAIDDPSSQRWSDANLDVLTTMVQDTMFQAILDTFPWATSQTDASITPAAGGIVDITTAGAILSQRYYRMQRLLRVSDSVEFQPRLFSEKVPQPSYFLQGTSIIVDPVSLVPFAVSYSFLPMRYTDLATDATNIGPGYPEGHEAALIYLTSSWAMTKGDQESISTIARLADMALDALLMHVARRSPTGGLSRVSSVKQMLVRNIIGANNAPPGGSA